VYLELIEFCDESVDENEGEGEEEEEEGEKRCDMDMSQVYSL